MIRNQCSNCETKRICSIYERNEKLKDVISMDVFKCNFFKDNNQNKKIMFDPNFYTQKDTFEAKPDAREYEKNLLNIEPVKEDKTLVTCKTCNGKDYASCISICSKCHCEVCGNCATSQGELTYCEKCWEENK